jgi:hypothetical protein
MDPWPRPGRVADGATTTGRATMERPGRSAVPPERPRQAVAARPCGGMRGGPGRPGRRELEPVE